MTEKPRGEVELEVRYAETDRMGVVHHANYLVWFEAARTRLCTRTGYHYADIEELGYLLMVTGATVRYRGAARYGDVVRVASWIDTLGSRTLTFGYSVSRADEILVTGTTDHVWVDLKRERHCRIPEDLKEPFLRLAGQQTFHRGSRA